MQTPWIQTVLITVFVVSLVGVGVGSVAAQSAPTCSAVNYDGEGNSTNPYEVGDVDQLQCIGEDHADADNQSDALSSDYELVADINASGTSSWNDTFAPVGKGGLVGGSPFTGDFDGNGHTVSDLTIDRPSESRVGLFGGFGDFSGATVKDLTLTDAEVTGNENVGVLAGAMNGGELRNVTVSGTVNSTTSGDSLTSQNAGGLVGGVTGTSATVVESSADVKVTALGGDGVAGETGASGVGGFVGRANSGTITDSSATGDLDAGDAVGGFVGIADGATIKTSYASGDAFSEGRVGGFAGLLQGDASLNKSYSTGDVFSRDNTASGAAAGGLIGKIDERNFLDPSTVSETYAVGSVDTSGFASTGGLVAEVNTDPGDPQESEVLSSYWDETTTGETSSAGGTDLTTSEMQGTSAVTNMDGFDFVETWDTVTSPDDYPVFGPNPECGDVTYDDGSGTVGDPYDVRNAAQLQCIQTQGLSANYELVSDIDASGTGDWNGGDGFDPIGDSGNEFTGTFNGNNHTVSNLTIDRSSEDFVGMFGYIGLPGSVTNLGVENITISAGNGVGSLAGWNDGSVNESYATGNVSAGGIDIGGLVGRVNGEVTDSYANTSVSGSNNVGGFVGQNNGGTIQTSYAVGNVSGGGGGGGGGGGPTPQPLGKDTYGRDSVVTPQEHTITTGIGGFVGTSSGTATDSYWDVNTTGQDTSAGGTGLTTEEMTGPSAATNMTGFDFTNTWDLTESYPRLFWEDASGINAVVGCREISSSGEYTLAGNLTSSSTCIEITSDNVVFDGNGNTIEADGVASNDGEYGIRVRADNVTVRNVTTSGWGEELSTQTTEEAPLTEEEKEVIEALSDGGNNPREEIGEMSNQPKSAGVLYENSEDGRIDGVTATDNYHGVTLESSETNDVTNVTADANRRGIRLTGSDSNTVTGNEANGNGVSGVSVSVGSDGNEVRKNTAGGNRYRGIYVFFSSGNEMAENEATNNDRLGAGLSLASDNNLTSNDFNANGREGVRLVDSDSNELTGNTANGNRIGYRLKGSIDGSDNNVLTNNTATGNTVTDIQIDGSTDNVVNSLTVAGSTHEFEGMLGASGQPEPPEGTTDVGRYFSAGSSTTDADEPFEVTVEYGEGVDNESELGVWGYDGNNGTWTQKDTTVNETDNLVRTEITEGYDVYGVFGGDAGVFSQPLLNASGFVSAPANTGEFDETLYEDLDGDGDGTDVDGTIAVFGELIRGNDFGLTDEQARALNWDDASPDDEVTPGDMVSLFGEQIRAD